MGEIPEPNGVEATYDAIKPIVEGALDKARVNNPDHYSDSDDTRRFGGSLELHEDEGDYGQVKTAWTADGTKDVSDTYIRHEVDGHSIEAGVKTDFSNTDIESHYGVKVGGSEDNVATEATVYKQDQDGNPVYDHTFKDTEKAGGLIAKLTDKKIN